MDIIYLNRYSKKRYGVMVTSSPEEKETPTF
jgi:hypothetical protein